VNTQAGGLIFAASHTASGATSFTGITDLNIDQGGFSKETSFAADANVNAETPRSVSGSHASGVLAIVSMR
jgi:hypothetical protein